MIAVLVQNAQDILNVEEPTEMEYHIIISQPVGIQNGVVLMENTVVKIIMTVAKKAIGECS